MAEPAQGAEVEVRLRGDRLRGHAALVDDAGVASTYLERYPRAQAALEATMSRSSSEWQRSSRAECHGWEVRDKPLGVLGTLPGSVQHAQPVRQWSDDVAFFVHTYDMAADERVQLEAGGVQIIRGEVAGLVVEDDRLTGVELTDGRVIARAVGTGALSRFCHRQPVKADERERSSLDARPAFACK